MVDGDSWPLMVSALGMGANYLGERQGAQATQHQIDSEMAQEQALAAQRRASISDLAMKLSPQAQLAQLRAIRARTMPGQQAQVSAVQQAYGGANPQLGQATAALGPSIGDAAWKNAFGIVGAQNRSAVGQEGLNERGIDASQWWLDRFRNNRIARAGDAGRLLRTTGTIATAYGLGKTNQAMATPAPNGDSHQLINAAGGVGADPYGPPSPYDPNAPIY